MTVELLPPNATAQEVALDQTMARISDIPVPIADVWNPDTCPLEVLPFLGWAYSVDYWDANWGEATKRQVVKASIKVHQHKGTIGALKDALGALDFTTEVQEWFEYSGDPYKFKVDVDLYDRGLNADEINTVTAIINMAKNVRSHLEKLTVHLNNKSNIPQIACALIAGVTTVISPYSIPEFSHESAVPVFASTLQGVHETTIYPQGAV